MYAALWRFVPGRWPVKLALLMLLMLIILAVCFVWVFPAIAPLMPFDDNTVGP